MVILCLVFPAWAHVHIYWPQVEGCYGKPGEAVRWRYFWGHPFEMAMDDAEPPRFFIFTPQGKKEAVPAKEITLQDADSGKARKAFEVEYKPAGPGDYYLCLEAVPIFIPEEKVFWQDYVKAPWHVGAEKGWDKAVGLEMEIVPLTRPYGWPGGSVFKGKALNKGRPLKTALVEIEKFHGFPVAQDKLPKDRHGEENAPLITRTAKTDLMGYFVCTLDSPGWWIISVATEGGKKVREGKPYPVEKRGCLWVYVEPAPAPLSPPPR
jgi:cobalt/nickel transport protein